MRRKPEIMSPAGYWPQLRAAVEAGADSVYFGLHHFSARAKTGFDLRELPEVVGALHARGVRGYLTFNTLVFDHEIVEAARTLGRIAEAGVDALIVQDIGAARLARQIAPSLELHASTQMSITDVRGVALARSLGASRVTLARELSLREIRAIRDQTECDLEIFVHGALCVAYSGQCFSSEAWGGRSANRGQCAQACRLPYQLLVDERVEPLGAARYLLSPGDLFALEQVPEIVEIGVAALKIEGRYKDAEYVALTTDAYRRAVDAAWVGREATADRLPLEQAYSRGLAPHFLTGTNHQTVVSGRAPRHRGMLMGQVARVDEAALTITPSAAAGVSPLKPGDGIVFDAADWRSPEEPEEGGRVYQAEVQPAGDVLLRFANRAICWGRIRPGDLVWRTNDPELARTLRRFTEASDPVSRQPVRVEVYAYPGFPLRSQWMLAKQRDVKVTLESDTSLEAARNRELTAESLGEQFGRLGGTPYVLETVTLHGSSPVFAPASLLNEMRRDAVAQLRKVQAEPRIVQTRPPQFPDPQPAYAGNVTPQLHVLIRRPGQLDAALELGPASITLDYLDLFGLRPSVSRIKAAGIAAAVASPRIFKPGESKIVDFLLSLETTILVRAAGLLHALGEAPHPPLVGDFSLNAANVLTVRALLEMGLQRLTPTHDLNAAQIANLARATGGVTLEPVAYGHLPVFHTEHCVFCRFLSEGTSYKDCGRPCERHHVALRDGTNRAHPVLADVGCRNTVFGGEAQEASAHLESWLAAGVRHFRLEFVDETPEQIREVYRAFRSALDDVLPASDLARRLRSIAPAGTTEGSLYVPPGFFSLPVLN